MNKCIWNAQINVHYSQSMYWLVENSTMFFLIKGLLFWSKELIHDPVSSLIPGHHQCCSFGCEKGAVNVEKISRIIWWKNNFGLISWEILPWIFLNTVIYSIQQVNLADDFSEFTGNFNSCIGVTYKIRSPSI